MALTIAQANLLLESRSEGAVFETIATIGRQTNYLGLANPHELKRFPKLAEMDASILRAPYAETFFTTALGARQIDSIDISQYEGATTVHDMNTPIPSKFHERYDAVIESGTLEHVFNFPIALQNCMKMLKTGGRVFLSLPVNNFAGHGFYQFSPELFFRAFSARNGFELKSVVLAESWLIGIERGLRFPLYRVRDPASTDGRVNLLNDYPTFALVHAVRIGSVPDTISAQQSDYLDVWAQVDEAQESLNRRANTPDEINRPTGILKMVARWLLSSLPQTWQLWFRAKYEYHFLHSLRRSELFAPVGSSNHGAAKNTRPR